MRSDPGALVTISEVENAVRAWILSTTGLDGSRVWFAQQPVPSPAIDSGEPRITIDVGDLRPIGQDELRHDFDSSRPAGQEIQYTAIGPREVTVSVQAFAEEGAGELLERAMTGLRLPSVRDALNAAGVGVLRVGTVRRLSVVRGTTYEDRALLEVVLQISSSAVERIGYFDRVEIVYGAGPALVLDGFVDRVGLLNLRRWAPATGAGSYFPRTLDPLRLRAVSGVQFSRAGANVVSGSVRDFGRLEDPRTDPRIHGVIGDSHTLAAWIRIDPLVVLAGVAVPSYRAFIVGGADGTVIAQQATYGFSFSPVTNELFLLTQTPGAGGASINLNSSKLAVPLAVGRWTHVVASVRRNLLDVEPNEWGATVDWYVDGVLANSEVGVGGTLSVGPRIPRPSLYPPPRIVTAIGGAYSNTVRAFTNGFDGALAELVLYPRALNATEAAALYRSGPFGLRP